MGTQPAQRTMARPASAGARGLRAGTRQQWIFDVDVANPTPASEAPVVEIVDLIIHSALTCAASDVHLEPTLDGVEIRFRVDGLLKPSMELPKWLHASLIARLKVMAGMDVAEKRLPQDGRIRFTADPDHEIDLRVSSLSTIHGEKIVLRILDSRRGVPPIDELGFSSSALEEVRQFLRHDHGMILVVGPTGSGKTTTLFSSLASFSSKRTNIVTIEEPVEYHLPGVNQTQIDSKINLTFASALRSILRQDPDVVLVGEIRDLETARVAMQAAQTGHLVLSTLHTDDAPSCVTRLTDIGIEPYITASALIGVIAQRLVRRVCLHCRQAYMPDAETLRAMNITPAEAATLTFYRAVGCSQCNDTGYRGRIAIYEIMPVTDVLRQHIANRSVPTALRHAALASGMTSLGDDGMLKVKAGITTPPELLRVVTRIGRPLTACTSCGNQITPGLAACLICGHPPGAACPHCSNAPTLTPAGTTPRPLNTCSRRLLAPAGPATGVDW